MTNRSSFGKTLSGQSTRELYENLVEIDPETRRSAFSAGPRSRPSRDRDLLC